MPDGLRFLVLFAIYSSTLLIPPRTSAINASEEVLQSELFDDLMHWAAKLSGLPDATHMPAIQPIGLDQLVQKVCPEDPVNCRSLISFYSTEEESIFYLDRLDLNDDTDLSFIVHEMVHHLQYAVQGEQLFATCQNLLAAESQAYAVQNKYLTQFKQWRRVGEAIRFINCDALDNSRSDASAN
jgi:hypothetical protein